MEWKVLEYVTGADRKYRILVLTPRALHVIVSLASFATVAWFRLLYLMRWTFAVHLPATPALQVLSSWVLGFAVHSQATPPKQPGPAAAGSWTQPGMTATPSTRPGPKCDLTCHSLDSSLLS